MNVCVCEPGIVRQGDAFSQLAVCLTKLTSKGQNLTFCIPVYLLGLVLNFIYFNCHSGLVASISYIHAVFVGTYLRITHVLLLSAEFATDSSLLALNVSLLLLMVVRRQGQFV